MSNNFHEIIKLCKVDQETQITRATQAEEDIFEMQVRAANMVSQSFKSVLCVLKNGHPLDILCDFHLINPSPLTSWIIFIENLLIFM